MLREFYCSRSATSLADLASLLNVAIYLILTRIIGAPLLFLSLLLVDSMDAAFRSSTRPFASSIILNPLTSIPPVSLGFLE